ncbi:MAG: internal scaffolding protein [Arizlama microvirus]|nr:MAG: internal scaffolding protein [Arizlama microvirus]
MSNKLSKQSRDELEKQAFKQERENHQHFENSKKNFSASRKRVQVHFSATDKYMATQAFKDDCDINNIIKRHAQGGDLPNRQLNPGFYADISEMPDYEEAANMVRMVTETFSELSSSVRNRFNNDPSQFIKFVDDPKNMKELVQLGLAELKTPAQPSEPVTHPSGSKLPNSSSQTPGQAAPAVGGGPSSAGEGT